MAQNSVADILNDKESRDRILAEALETSGDDLFDFIPTCALGGSSRDPNEEFALSDKAPKIQEINYRKSSPEMIIEGRAVLNDGRRVYWK